jgi:hypothetical protein
MIRLIFLFSIAPFCVFGQKQIISFGARADSTGAVLIIQQVVSISGDTTHTTAIKFKTASDALPMVLRIREGVTADSISISFASSENRRHAMELNLIISALDKISNIVREQNVKETIEEEIRRLREENIRLKEQRN